MDSFDRAKAIRYVNEHSFVADLIPGGIVVFIPASYCAPHPMAGQTGIEGIECRSFADVRRALGY